MLQIDAWMLIDLKQIIKYMCIYLYSLARLFNVQCATLFTSNDVSSHVGLTSPAKLDPSRNFDLKGAFSFSGRKLCFTTVSRMRCKTKELLIVKKLYTVVLLFLLL